MRTILDSSKILKRFSFSRYAMTLLSGLVSFTGCICLYLWGTWKCHGDCALPLLGVKEFHILRKIRDMHELLMEKYQKYSNCTTGLSNRHGEVRKLRASSEMQPRSPWPIGPDIDQPATRPLADILQSEHCSSYYRFGCIDDGLFSTCMGIHSRATKSIPADTYYGH